MWQQQPDAMSDENWKAMSYMGLLIALYLV
jgi:hypothetical protein